MRNQKGFILVFALVIIMLIMLSLLALFVISYNDLAMATTASKSMKAYYIAEAGLARKLMELRTGVTGCDGDVPPNTSFPLVGGDSGTLWVHVTHDGAHTYNNLLAYQFVSIGTYKTVSRTLTLIVRQASWSMFSYMTNSENQLLWHAKNPIWFITDDILTGPLFTNDRINIYGDPIFEGPVTSACIDPANPTAQPNLTINYYHQHTTAPFEDNPDFKDSLTLGAIAMQMPSTSFYNDLVTDASAASGGLTLYPSSSVRDWNKARITFLSDGTLSFYNGKTTTPYTLPVNGAIAISSGDVEVCGMLKGNVTLAVPGDIYVTNNLVYKTDPRTDSSSNDLLGLVAKNNVYIDPSAPAKVEVDAYIIAITGSFEVEDYGGALKDTLSLYGGVTQTTRGIVGTFDPVSGDRQSGYIKDYNYDPRLRWIAPQFFPVAKDANGRLLYAKILWTEN